MVASARSQQPLIPRDFGLDQDWRIAGLLDSCCRFTSVKCRLESFGEFVVCEVGTRQNARTTIDNRLAETAPT